MRYVEAKALLAIGSIVVVAGSAAAAVRMIQSHRVLPHASSPTTIAKVHSVSPTPTPTMTDPPKPKSTPAASGTHATTPTSPRSDVADNAGTSQQPPVVTKADPPTYQVNEQFLGTSLNSDLWQAMTYPTGYRNHEEEDYSPSQVQVADGMLQITATRDSTGQWHSGEVHSKWHYTYGEFEVRMAISTLGPGVWPAAWLMGTSDSWPDCGEIDMMESINSDPTAYGTIHAGGSAGPWQLQYSLANIDVTKFHTYTLVKQPGTMSWWIDGVKQGDWSQSQTPTGGVWPFESHSNLALLNLAIGGDWPGPSSAATPNNITLNVDYYTVKNGW